MPTRWFYERLHAHVRQGLSVRRTIARQRTAFQTMEILDTEAYGRALVLDGVIQTTEGDEFVYHEMMTHVPMFAHPNPRRILIVGGGDGGIARQVLRHPGVERVTMVEIDPDVIRTCRRHLPKICGRAFEDRRLRVVVDDGARYVRRTQDQFDVAIIDSPDPIGPAVVLFVTEFYRNVARVLSRPGILVRQTGSTILQSWEMGQAARRLGQVFRTVVPYVAAIPTYIGGFFGFLFASNEVHPGRVRPSRLATRIRQARLVCRYYTPAIHRACFALPAHVRALLPPA